jgi:acyl-CoA dehydrogenase
MDFQHAERSRGLQEHVRQFARRHVEPVEELYYEQVKPEVPQGASCLTRIEGVGARAGLVESVPVRRAWRWPYQPRKCASRRKSSGARFGRLKSSRRRIPATSSSYGITAHRAARSLAASPDGRRIRPAFSMTEPAVASSDATNIQCDIRSDGQHYVINGRKWFTSGAMNEDCIAAC